MCTSDNTSPLRAALAWLKQHGHRVTQQQVGEWCGVKQQTVGDWLDRRGGFVPADAALTIEHELVRRGCGVVTRRDLCPEFPWHLAEAPAACGVGKAGAGTAPLCATAPAPSSCTTEGEACNAS